MRASRLDFLLSSPARRCSILPFFGVGSFGGGNLEGESFDFLHEIRARDLRAR